jgi:hypothetical protein
MGTYERPGTGKKVAAVMSIGALVNAGFIGCGSSRQNDWLATDGAAGRINMGDVQQALEDSADPSEFERRVNEIYEGNFPILIKVEDRGSQKVISGFEDLDNSGTINESTDDMLFSATLGGEEYDLRGSGANSYYSHHGGMSFGNMLFFSWMMSPGRFGGGPYYTSPQRARTIRQDRSRYRSSSSYSSQRVANRSYSNATRTANPQAFSSNTQNVSRQRGAFQQRQMSQIRASRARASSRSSSRSGMRSGS